MTSLPRVRSGLLRHPLDQQVLVYDATLDRVHLVDPTTACVIDLLEEGVHSPEQLVEQIGIRLDIAPDRALLVLAIDELRNSGLLDESGENIARVDQVSRRNMVRKLALTGAAAFLVPAVATLTATRGFAQGSSNLPLGAACTSDPQCQSGLCTSGVCACIVKNDPCPSGQLGDDRADPNCCNGQCKCNTSGCRCG